MRFDALLCWHTDRLYRNMRDLERVIEIADANRIEIRTVQGGTLDLSTSAGRMVARILGSVARQESEHSSERRKRANAQRAAAGQWSTTRRPFGYTRTGDPVEPEAKAIRTAVHDVLAGKSVRQVAREWNAAGLQTTGKATEWRSPMVRRVLLNPRCAALVVHQGKTVGPGDRSNHPAHRIRRRTVTRGAAGRTTQTPVRGRPAPARRCEHRVAVARVGRIR
jgi:site-specific DNA recombinase